MSETRTVGIDYGLVRIGIAVSDPTHLIAAPLMTLQAEKKSPATIAKLLAELEKHQKEYSYTIKEIVIGMPLMMSGKQGLQADEVQHFVAQLREATETPIVTWDERLTTVQAERALREAKMSRKKRMKVVDKVAAVIILQSYLDSLRI